MTAGLDMNKVHGMNDRGGAETPGLTPSQRLQFSQMLDKLYQCCSDRHVYLSEKHGVPQAELRCLLLFGGERYLTAKGIAGRLNIAKSRVTKLVDGLVAKGLLNKVADPADSRVTLLALTPAGQKKRQEIVAAMDSMRDSVLEYIDPLRRDTVLDSLEILKAAMERMGEALE